MNRTFTKMSHPMKGILLFAASMLVSACSGTSESTLRGRWVGADGSATLDLSSDGKFEVVGLPAQVACSSEEVSGVLSGGGKWQFDRQGDRVLLSFSKLSNSKCDVPYLGHVFLRSDNTLQAIPDVDKPWDEITYHRR